MNKKDKFFLYICAYVIDFPIYFPLFLLVSFYGGSFVELNMAEASPQTSLQLQFQTSKPQGLLFLASGKTDYCLTELRSGYVQVCFITVTKKYICVARIYQSFLKAVVYNKISKQVAV